MTTLDPRLVHPSLAGVAPALVRHGDVQGFGLPEPQRLVAEAIVALLGSARMPDEMEDYVGAMNAALDAEARLRSLPPTSEVAAKLDALLDAFRRLEQATRGLESARSGMAGDMALGYMDLARDDMRTLASEAWNS